MAVESGSSIADLNPLWPLGTDSPREGDDHIRIIKSLIQQTWPNINNPVTLTDEEMNLLVNAFLSTGDEMTGDIEMNEAGVVFADDGFGVVFRHVDRTVPETPVPDDFPFAQITGTKATGIVLEILDPTTGVLENRATLAADSMKLNATPAADSNDTQIATTEFVKRFSGQILHMRDEKASGTAGGASQATTLEDRDLNTVLSNNITGASLDEVTGIFTLPAGQYDVDIHVPAYKVNAFKAFLYDVTGAAVVIIGANGQSGDGDHVMTESLIRGGFVLAAETELKIQQYGTTASGEGFGAPVGILNINEVYTDVLIRTLS